jgi:hypothetical protein
MSVSTVFDVTVRPTGLIAVPEVERRDRDRWIRLVATAVSALCAFISVVLVSMSAVLLGLS